MTLAAYLLLMWGAVLLSVATAYALYRADSALGIAGVFVVSAVSLIVLPGYFVLMEVWGPGRMTLEPRSCTIHDHHFFRIERYWKMGETPLKLMFKGTPFRPWIYRLLGVRMGRMVFDDGCAITEKGLVEIGDHCCLNEATSLQSHSLEDGLFKSDHIRLGDRCTLGPAAFVNYGVRVAADATLLADSFLMKGSVVGRGQTWCGNPARAADLCRQATDSGGPVATTELAGP